MVSQFTTSACHAEEVHGEINIKRLKIVKERHCRVHKLIKHTYLSSKQVDDLKGVFNDAHCHQFLAVVTSVHHQRVGQTFDNRALGLAEPLGLVATGRMGQVLGMLLLDRDVILPEIAK